MDKPIYQHDSASEEKFLRKNTRPFSFSEKGEPVFDGKNFSRSEFSKLIVEMRGIMKRANGIGLSANQIGLPYRLFVAQIPSPRGESKFYCVLNPELEANGREKDSAEEGCLSVVGVYGLVERPARVTLRGFDRSGKPLKIKAWGLLARVFQHEMDHLDGGLFIDKAKELHKVEMG